MNRSSAPWRVAALLALAAAVLPACSGGSEAKPNSSSARQLVKELVAANVCRDPRPSTPESPSRSWVCDLKPPDGGNRSYITVTTFQSSNVGLGWPPHHLLCASKSTLGFVLGPTWVALVTPASRRDVVVRTIGGRKYVQRCADPDTSGPGRSTPVTTLG